MLTKDPYFLDISAFCILFCAFDIVRWTVVGSWGLFLIMEAVDIWPLHGQGRLVENISQLKMEKRGEVDGGGLYVTTMNIRL